MPQRVTLHPQRMQHLRGPPIAGSRPTRLRCASVRRTFPSAHVRRRCAGLTPPGPSSTPQAVARGGSRQLRASCPRLFRDLLAVLSGLRPSFMLDYGLLQPEQLATAAARLAATLGLQPVAAVCCVAVLGGCCYVVRPEALPGPGACCCGSLADAAQRQRAARGAAVQQGQPPAEQQAQASSAVPAALAPPVLFVAFDGPRPRWASAGEASQAAAALEALRDGLLASLLPAQHPPGHQRLPAGCSGRSASAAVCPPLPVVHAEDLPGWQGVAPPTASGYLLGYPAVYLCHGLEGAQAACRGLSSGSLCLHTVATGFAALPAEVPQPHDQPLLGFSVPAELESPEWTACRDAWWAALQGRASRAAAASGGLVCWEQLLLSISLQPPRPVAL